MPAPTHLSFLGVAKESVKGTAVAAVDFIPVKSISPVDTVMYIDDTGMRGAMVEVYNEIAGPTFSEVSFGGDVFPDTIGYAVAGVLGDVVTTGGAAPYSHVAAVKNSSDGQPISYTLSDYSATAATARQYAAMQFSELSFKFSGDGLLEYSAKAKGFVSGTATKPTASFTTVTPIAGWRGAVTIAGSNSTILLDGTVEIKRPVSPLHTLDGSANPYKLWAGPVGVSGKLSFVAEDEAELVRYLTNTQPTMVIDFQQGASSTLTEVKFQMTKCAYTVASINRGKDFVTVDVGYTALANSTDVGASGGFSPIKVTLQNAKAASTFV